MIRGLKDKLNYLLGLNFVKDVFILQIGSFFSTGLVLITSIVYTRFLGSEIYGNYILIFAFAGFINLFMDWGSGYTTLTLLSEAYTKNDKEEVKNIITYFLKINAIAFVIIGLLAIIFSPYLSNLFYHQPFIGSLARLIILASIIRVFFSLLLIILQVLRKIKHLTTVENINKLFLSLVPITFVLFGFSLWGIVWGHLLTAVCFIFFSLAVYYYLSTADRLLPSMTEIFKNFNEVKIIKYFKFGIFVAIDKNLSSFFVILPLIILGALATPEQVANLKIAIAYLALPKIFLKPIGRLLQVQLPKAKAVGIRDLRSNFYKSLWYSGFAFAALTIIFLILAPFLITVFYGQEFSLSLTLVYPLSLSVIFSGFMIGVGSMYRTINKIQVSIMINIVNLISGLILFVISLRYMSPLRTTVLVLIYWALFSFIIHFLFIRRNLTVLTEKKI